MKINNAAIALLALCGCSGADGTQGVQGLVGPSGTPGDNCEVTTLVPPYPNGAHNGGVLVTCPDSQALILNGVQGVPGTSVTPVQFCPNSTDYPNTFSEVGFCIGGTLYASYSANGGFLTEIVPGNYSSDGINSSCSFTVGVNCEITQ